MRRGAERLTPQAAPRRLFCMRLLSLSALGVEESRSEEWSGDMRRLRGAKRLMRSRSPALVGPAMLEPPLRPDMLLEQGE